MPLDSGQAPEWTGDLFDATCGAKGSRPVWRIAPED
jgi:hypothetical protein